MPDFGLQAKAFQAGGEFAAALGKVLWELTCAKERPPLSETLEVLAVSSPPVMPYEWGGGAWGPVVNYADSPAGIGLDCSGTCTVVLQRLGMLQLGHRVTSGGLPDMVEFAKVRTPLPGSILRYEGHVRLCVVPGKMCLEAHGEGSAHSDRGRVEVTPWISYREKDGQNPTYYHPKGTLGQYNVAQLVAYAAARKGGGSRDGIPAGWRLL